jgi:hypothetical protein
MKQPRKVEDRPSVEILLEDVNKIGYEATGRKYKVSGNNIKKWLKQYGDTTKKEWVCIIIGS